MLRAYQAKESRDVEPGEFFFGHHPALKTQESSPLKGIRLRAVWEFHKTTPAQSQERDTLNHA